MIVVANAAVGKPWAPHAVGILAGLLAGATFLFGAIDLVSGGSGPHNPAGVNAGIMLTALAAAALASRPVRDAAARILPIDPDSPVHSLALVLAVILLGTQLSSLVFTDVLKADQQLPALTVGDLVAQEVPFLVIAFAGVGLYTRRDLAGSFGRLGLVVPAWWHLVLALAAAGLFLGLGQVSDALSQSLTPAVSAQVNRTADHLFGGLADPVGILAISLIPGICEDVLFRGALQPRLGLIATAVLFTAIHTEYGFSIDALAILAFAIGLGLIRKYANTTASVSCHVAYNLLVGAQLTGPLTGVVVAVAVILGGLVAYVVWSRRRRDQDPMAENAVVR